MAKLVGSSPTAGNSHYSFKGKILDYTSYPRPLKKHRDTFIYGLMDDLVEYGLKSSVARSVAGAVCELMSRDDLYYHNYIHPLAMFDFARKNGIELSLSDRLAVWFHDVVYIQGALDNEIKSCHVFGALINKSNETEWIKTWGAIDGTAYFLRQTKDLGTWPNFKIMDLDLHSFGLPYNDFKHCAELVQKELGTTPQQSIAFYDLLLRRAPIFRTEEFSRFEQTALDNIQRYKDEHKV